MRRSTQPSAWSKLSPPTRVVTYATRRPERRNVESVSSKPGLVSLKRFGVRMRALQT